MSVSTLDSAVLWGQAFEIAVKRGVIAYLRDRKLIAPDHSQIVQWANTRSAKLYSGIRHELGLLDDNVIEQANRATAHILVMGYGLGWTCMRECLARFKGNLTLKGLWCPLTLPKLVRDRDSEAQAAADALKEVFGIQGLTGSLVAKGGPAWSDFTLWLTAGRKEENHLVVLEFSYNATQKIPDFSRETDHLEELARYVRLLDIRGVFSRVCAEVKGERFELSPALASHLGAFTSRDKPFYKLCQGASYVDTTIDLLRHARKLSGPIHGRVIAVTSNGFESLSANFTEGIVDSRRTLLTQLGNAYRQSIKVGDEAPQERLQDEMRMVFNQLARALPADLKKQVESLARMPEPSEEVAFDFREKVDDFYRPTDQFTASSALGNVHDIAEVDAYFGKPAKAAIGAELSKFENAGRVTLRGLHGAAVVAALKSSKRGSFNVLALEGNPGIGKTTAVRRYLMEFAREGYLFLYVSPRVVINKEVTDKFAHNEDGSASGILTVTTNATLIRNASVGYQEMVVKQGGPSRLVDSAAVVEGVDGLAIPETFNTWFITPEEEGELENVYGGQRFKKESINERNDLIRERQLPGVLRTLGVGAQRLLAANDEVCRIVLTAAIQGYRETEGGTTINGLSRLFHDINSKSRAGKAERAKFASRFPNIIVMLDEVAGDGAGALFVDEIAKWLANQFIEPFENDAGGSPFTVTLIISDASLGNENVLESYLAARPVAPEKVLISKSGGNNCFKLAATRFPVGSTQADVLHVMTNSFPATELEIQYRMKLHRLEPETRDDGAPKTVRERVRSQGDALLLRSAHNEISRAIREGARQAIFFAQNKDFLSLLRTMLCQGGTFNIGGSELSLGDALLTADEVAILDSSVKPSERKTLISDEVRDTKRVFLMTSSGARGVSFPRATRIIAAIPRFNIESSLMEVAQLIYRGRGSYKDNVTGKMVNGDDVPRELVMLVDDFLPQEELQEDPRIWLRRASDLLTLVLMLRGTIHTRIKGDAALPGKDLAIVPVGTIGSSELIATMSQALTTVLKEGNVFTLRTASKDLGALVAAAVQNVIDLFSTYTIQGEAPPEGYRSFTDPTELDNFSYAVAQQNAALAPEVSDDSRIPQTSYCVGPFWLEDWSPLQKRESLIFDRYSDAVDEAEKALKGQLAAIQHRHELPPKLRDSARDLYRILAREKEDAKREFATLKALNSKATWLTLPLDYPRFWRKASEKDGTRVVIREADDWHNALARAMQTISNIVPVLPRFEDYPFAASIGTPDPVRLYQVFDDRYFMASTELNLLNALLLA